MSNYPVPPPSYGSTTPTKSHAQESAEPLLGGQRYHESGPSSGGAFYDQPAAGDLPDDFKVGLLLRMLSTIILIESSLASMVSLSLRVLLRSGTLL